MTEIKTEANVLRNEKITGDICRLTLHAPAIAATAIAGQFVMVKAGLACDPPLLRRPFSIHNVSPDGNIQLLFKSVGKGTIYLAKCRNGDTLSLVGPLGRGFTLPVQPKNICLVGGGMGIAPLFYLARQLLAKNTRAEDIQILLGAATASEIKTLESDFNSLGVSVFSATDDGSTGHHGLVTDLLRDNLDHNQQWNIYSCGPHPMMKAVATYCSEKKWPCQVFLETLMACGISACLGCAIRSSSSFAANNEKSYLHVCKDGPVFKAGDVSW
jgi:dihydroorotate dehydrogenase electron transfer subunit